jgi:hypothetical protein
MPNLRLPVAPLNGGVSTQPFDNRLPNQTVTSNNTILKLQRGLEKRPGSTLIGELNWTNGSFNTGMKTHFFSYGNEQYVMLIDGAQATDANKLQVFNLSDGTKCTINGGADVANARSYLNNGTPIPRDKIKCITYGSTTIIVNTTKVVATSGTVTRTTTKVVSDLVIPPTSAASAYTVGDIVHALNATVGYPPGYYEVLEVDTDLDGPWYERLEALSSGNTISSATMPISLVRTALNTFTLNTIEYNKRQSGNATTNPAPDFVGQTISDVCIFQDRMWIAHETGVYTSQAGDIFNFWVDDYTNVVDSDPISLPLPGPDASGISWLVPLDDKILVFGTPNSQYEISARDFFTPSTANLQPTTKFECSNLVRPQIAGQPVHFLENKPNSSALWEYYYDFGSDANLAKEASIQCQGYLPERPYYMDNSTNNNMLFVAEPDSSNIYVYHYHWEEAQKIQSAFAQWKLYDYSQASANIVGIKAYGSYLFVVVQRLGKVWLERLEISTPATTDGLAFPVALDAKITTTGTYDAATNLTTFTLTDWADTELEDIESEDPEEPPTSVNAYRIVLTGTGWGDQAGTTIIPERCCRQWTNHTDGQRRLGTRQ